MSFDKDVKGIADLADAFQPGLQALSHPDRTHITAKKPKNLAGSVDIDNTLKAKLPNAARWDYVIANKRAGGGEKLYWIEVHPASSTGNIKEIDEKLKWLSNWLVSTAHQLNRQPRAFIWLASGKSSYTQASPQLKALAAKGLLFKGSHLVIPEYD